jgi:hypothetical protein
LLITSLESLSWLIAPTISFILSLPLFAMRLLFSASCEACRVFSAFCAIIEEVSFIVAEVSSIEAA